MGTENRYLNTTIQVLEDLRSAQYHAVCLDDGKLANNGEEAFGILLSKPNINEHGEIAYLGESRFAAGAAITKGDKLAVTTSGWFTTAGSNDPVVGECKYTVTSGSVGTGIFTFNAKDATGFRLSVTATEVTSAGMAYALNDNKLANNSREADGITESAISAGGTGKIVLLGKVTATYANSYGIGHRLMAVESGYMSEVTSGHAHNAVTLTAADSGGTGVVLFTGVGATLA